MKEPAKKLARMLLGEYSAYFVYAQPARSDLTGRPGLSVAAVDQIAIRSSIDPLMSEQAGYAGADAQAYACFDQGRMVGVCFYWFGARYRQRNFWPLSDGEAKLVQIVSLPDMRGRGVATTLIAASCRDMLQKGFSRLYARIWHSNVPSLCAFERAGWTRVAFVAEINPLRRSQPVRLCFPWRPLNLSA